MCSSVWNENGKTATKCLTLGTLVWMMVHWKARCTQGAQCRAQRSTSLWSFVTFPNLFTENECKMRSLHPDERKKHLYFPIPHFFDYFFLLLWDVLRNFCQDSSTYMHCHWQPHTVMMQIRISFCFCQTTSTSEWILDFDQGSQTQNWEDKPSGLWLSCHPSKVQSSKTERIITQHPQTRRLRVYFDKNVSSLRKNLH